MNVTTAVMTELGNAIDTPEGQAALVLARLLDKGDLTGGEHASVSRELRQALADVRRQPAASAGDTVDDLRQRRAKRHRA